MSETDIWKDVSKPKYLLYQPVLSLIDLMKSLGFDHQAEHTETQEHFDFVNALGMTGLIQNAICDVSLEGYLRGALLQEWLPFWKSASEKLWASNIITLEDQKYWALNQLAYSGRVQALLRRRQYSHIFVDEFQDINILDLYLISQIALISDASLTIVGDDDQCIYEWRGCTSKFIQKPDDFMKALLQDDTFEEFVLEYNYRCPRNIVTHSNKLISQNLDRVDKKMVPVRSEDTNIRVIPLPAAYFAMNVIDELVAELGEKHPNHTIAIVGRKKCQLIPLQILLTKRGTKFAVDTDLNVFNGKAFGDFRHFLELPEIYSDDRPSAKNVADMMALLNRIQKTPVSKNETNEIKHWLTEQQPKTLLHAVNLFHTYSGKFRRGCVAPAEVSTRLQSFLEQSSVVSCLQAAGGVFKGFQKNFVKSKEDIFYSDPPFSHLADLAVNYGDDFQGFLRDIDRAIERAATNEPQRAKVELMTALRTKGREFDTVIVLDANDGIWPNKMSVKGGRIEEERRLFYVTTTRTKNNLLLFESGRVQGKRLSSSPFIDEMELPDNAWLSHPKIEELSSALLAQLKV